MFTELITPGTMFVYSERLNHDGENTIIAIARLEKTNSGKYFVKHEIEIRPECDTSERREAYDLCHEFISKKMSEENL